MRRREYLKLIGLSLPAWPLLGAASFPTTVADRVDRLFRTPGPRPNGLQATREGLWILDEQTNRASLVEYGSGRIKHELETPAERGSGITFDGLSLWIASTHNRKLIKIDAETGELQAEFDTPGSGVLKWGELNPNAVATGADGVEWRRGDIFLAVPPAARIFIVKPRDGSAVRSIPSPGIRPHGLGWDPDGSLWCADSGCRAFYKLEAASGKVIKQHLLPFAKPEVNGKVLVPHGMSIWRRYIYFCVAETAEVYRTPLVSRMS
jgi:sugar lactone lactonase YvrE